MNPIALLAAVITLGASILTLAPAAAHSLAELQTMLRDQEKNFEPIDKEAPQFALRDQDGRVVRLTDLQGKVVVLNFVGASCSDVFRRQAERIAEIQSMINQSPMKHQVQFVTIETKPRRDGDRGDSVLTDYHRADGIDPVNWVFLTVDAGRSEGTRELAEQFDHNVKATGQGAQDVVTHIIDNEGRWRANFRGLGFKPINVVVFVNALVNDITRPHHDPDVGFWQTLKRWF